MNLRALIPMSLLKVKKSDGELRKMQQSITNDVSALCTTRICNSRGR